MRILVVDDDPSIRELLTAQLQLAGHDVTVATDGQAALDAVGRHAPDAMVVDVMMPGVNGWQVLEALGAAPGGRQFPVVVLSARDLRDDVRRGYELGASAVLAKPYDADELLSVLTTLHDGLLNTR